MAKQERLIDWCAEAKDLYEKMGEKINDEDTTWPQKEWLSKQMKALKLSDMEFLGYVLQFDSEGVMYRLVDFLGNAMEVALEKQYKLKNLHPEKGGGKNESDMSKTVNVKDG